MRPVRWGILGTGRMAAAMAVELQNLRAQGIQLRAVASRSARAATDFASRHGIPSSYGAYPELAEDPGIDIVYVATPPSEHADHMMLCLQNHKAVLCEKPFTLSARQARLVIETARANKLFLMEAMWTRFLPAITDLRGLISRGTLGTINLIISGGAFVPDCPPSYYLLNAALGGGALLDAGVYLVSLSSMLLGAPSRVHAALDLGSGGVDEQDALMLEHDSGAKALLYVSMRSRRAPDMEIVGTQGRILVGAPVFKPSLLTLITHCGSQETREFVINGSGYGYQLLAAADALRNGQTECAIMPLAETLSIMETLDEARRQSGFRYPGEDTAGSAAV
ncbi:MAG: Gfo/Idh/MocA family oxidoreductase [Proteobacteria bacterium]|nr:Gfo/Idh/MocA family oxidoreductase [Pseudomonadota bacterium]